MSSDGSARYDRVLERRRAVALARHFREAEGLSIAQIAERLDRSPARVQALLLRPHGGEGAGGQGTIRRRVRWLWAAGPGHPASSMRLSTSGGPSVSVYLRTG